MDELITVLIVDTNRTSLALMDMMLRKLPHCSTLLYSDPAALLARLEGLAFDVALFVLHPGTDGLGLARRVRGSERHGGKPILIAADHIDREVTAAARAAGAAELLHKPIDPVHLRTAVANLTRTGSTSAVHTAEAAGAEEELISLLQRTAGMRDREPPLHAVRVGHYCAILAKQLGLNPEECRLIRSAAPLHDLGKAALPDEILLKRGVLLAEERKRMEEHTRIGHMLLSTARAPVLKLAAEIALSHHERWDGSGYPQGLKGQAIPLSGRIAAVADVFDALTRLHQHKTAWSLANAFNYLHENAGEQFDPSCVAAFATARDEIAAVMQAMPDDENDGAVDAA